MTRIPLDVTLRNISNELARLSAIAANVDEVMGDLVTKLPPDDMSHQAAMQDVDLLRQSLDCLMVLLSNVAEQQDVSSGVLAPDAGQGVYLRDLRDAVLTSYQAS
ncbi:hypothetical protein [Marinibacterium profundimaris]|uniref:Uncharacterized protein n=1 Tax=Marinibacterium profundimaris TaxID=1679460 RepID=A0A225NL05_9RHOB|nr:hypothetical protein [Marinibacterium profundimaris]OWU74868.1 hypothetical protein ATO3_09805 [Marinibacterium profundimaris]